MKELKKLTCSINLSNIVDKPYQQNIVDLIRMTCDDAIEQNLINIEYTFYYNGAPTENSVKLFMQEFKSYSNVKVQKMCDFNAKSVWFFIITEDEKNMKNLGRTYYIIKTLSEKSLTQALLDFYSKAKLQIQMSNRKR